MNRDAKAVAIIPARAGSKGVIGKNLRIIAGKPLVAWSINAAINSNLIQAVFVSTDSDKIAEVALSCGAKVVKRPLEISGDEASSEAALLHAVYEIECQGLKFEDIVFLQCTSPMTTTDDIDACIRRMHKENADTAFTVKEFYYFVWKMTKDGECVGINHDKFFRPRRQEREPQYEENGAVYVMKKTGFLSAQHRFFGKTVMSLMPEERSFEIDTEADIEFAEWALSKRTIKKLKRPFPSRVDAIVFDFDGVMTDDTVLVSENGEESVRCSREDGQGIARAREWGIPLLVLSTEANRVVSVRCEKLKLPVIQNAGLTTKVESLQSWAIANSVNLSYVIFIGNDLNDLECMKEVGFAIAPANANSSAKSVADHILAKSGGNGAVRECLEFIGGKIGKVL